MRNTTPNDQKTLTTHLSYQFWTRMIVLALALIMAFVFQNFEWTAPGTRQNLIWIPILLIFGSMVVTFFRDMKLVKDPDTGLPNGIKAIAPRFRVSGLAADFVSLMFLVAFTGGIDSPFVPLFVIALLVGDVCIDDPRRRDIIMGVFVATSIIGVITPTLDDFRRVLSSSNALASSLWDIPHRTRVIIQLGIFTVGAIFGSFVLRAHIDVLRSSAKPNTPPSLSGDSQA